MMPLASTSPAQLFLVLWQKAQAMTAFQRDTAAQADATFQQNLARALQQDDEQVATEACQRLLAAALLAAAMPNEQNGIILASLHAIDNAFYLIHPRTRFSPATARRRPTLPEWLRNMRDARFIDGEYTRNDEYRLITRGPLVRLPRNETASNAENLADRFTALSIVPHHLKLEHRTIATRHIVVSIDTARGVPVGRMPRREEVVFIPVAEAVDDLLIHTRHVATQPLADFRLAPALNAAQQIVAALRSAGTGDIAFAPELVVHEDHADQMKTALRTLGPNRPRLIVAGSGQTRAKNNDGQSWNEARILNSRGHDLWRQRKLWPAGLGASRAIALGLADPGNKLVMEDTAEGDTLLIADLDGLGRCVVLICQDIKAQPLADELVQHFQPDWIFVPILDPGISAGRWAHQQVFGLSELSNARFMVASSTALAKRLSNPDPVACGLCVGPKAADPLNHDTGRALALIEVVSPPGPAGYGVIQWGGSGWTQTVLAVKAPIPP